MYEVCECDHVQDVLLVVAVVVVVVVGSAGHHDQPREEEGQRGGEGVAQLAVHQQAAHAQWLPPACTTTTLGQLVQVQQLSETQQPIRYNSCLKHSS